MNIHDVLERSAARCGDSPALAMCFDGGDYQQFTYAQTAQRVEVFSGGIARAGVRAGDRVALMAPNSPQWAFAFFALARLGVCAVVMDCALPEDTLADLIAQADVRAVICARKFLPVTDLLPADGNLSASQLPILDIDGDLRPFAGKPAALPPDYMQTPDVDADAAVIVFSSGTTSGYKGVVHTHEALCWAAQTGAECNGLTPRDRLLCTLPLSHLYGLIAKLLAPLYRGAFVCYIESNSAKPLLAAFQKIRPTAFCCVPRVFDMFRAKAMDMIAAKGRAPAAVIRILMRVSAFLYKQFGIRAGRVLFRRILDYFGGCCFQFMSGGAPLSPQTERFFLALAAPIYNNYALTEAGLPLIASRPAHNRAGTCGQPVGGARMRIHQPDTRGVGEIRVKSPGMMKGYFRNQRATDDAVDIDGWLITGDTGYITRRGDLVVTGRLKENIILPTGVALSPADIERRYGFIPGAAQLAVCGIPAAVGSYDEIHAFVVPDESDDNARQTVRAAILRLGVDIPAAMRISQIHFIPAMPSTTLQKPRRFLLREMLMAAPEGKPAARKPLPPVAEPVARAIRAMRFDDKPIAADDRVVEDLGFDSLTLTDLCLRLEEATGKDALHLLRPNMTVLELAQALDAAQPGEKALYAGRFNLSEYPKRRRFIDYAVFYALKALFTAAWRFDVQGLSNLPQTGNYILCPNHQTDLDAVFILMHFKPALRENISTMATMEHTDTAFRRCLFRMSGGIPVDRRGNPGPSYMRCREVLSGGRVLLIHPEGTRTRDGAVGAFKKGAARLAIECGVPIVPVRIDGAFAVFPNTRRIPTLTGRPIVRISFGLPVAPGNMDAAALTARVREDLLAL